MNAGTENITYKAPLTDFENQYIEARKKEQRYYTNEQVASLPDISATHPHHAEWQLRKISCYRLLDYIKKIRKPSCILEVGCGNGWLASKIAEVEEVTITGIDINTLELKQASYVFKHKPNLHFIPGDIRDGLLSDQKFDIIIFAASIQYFPSLEQILKTSMELLTVIGEIHIIDSSLYKDGEEINARQRTQTYFESLGFPRMAEYYFHHKFSDLHKFKYKVLYDPFSFINKLTRKHNPFYWIRINQ